MKLSMQAIVIFVVSIDFFAAVSIKFFGAVFIDLFAAVFKCRLFN